MGVDQYTTIGGFIRISEQKHDVGEYVYSCPNGHKVSHQQYCSTCGSEVITTKKSKMKSINGCDALGLINLPEEIWTDEMDDEWHSWDCTNFIVKMNDENDFDGWCEGGETDFNDENLKTIARLRNQFINDPACQILTKALTDAGIEHTVCYGIYSYWS